eukprot:COSAG02_NODE_984_length_15467_cov_20.165799_9_plen_188_part_00
MTDCASPTNKLGRCIGAANLCASRTCVWRKGCPGGGPPGLPNARGGVACLDAPATLDLRFTRLYSDETRLLALPGARPPAASAIAWRRPRPVPSTHRCRDLPSGCCSVHRIPAPTHSCTAPLPHGRTGMRQGNHPPCSVAAAAGAGAHQLRVRVAPPAPAVGYKSVQRALSGTVRRYGVHEHVRYSQ